MISVIIPSYNNPEYLSYCLTTSILNQTNKNEFIVIIDGNTSAYENIIKDWRALALNIKIIPFDENAGLAFALNTGVQYANSEKILVINEDNVLPSGWDVVCEDIYNDDIVTSFMQVEPQQSIFHFKYQDFGASPSTFKMTEFLEWEQQNRIKNDASIYPYSDKGCLFPFLISKEKYMIVGGFDTSYSSPFVVDLDFWYKLQLAKMGFRTSSHMIVYHFGSRSTKKRDGNTTDWVNNEREAIEQFNAKWGFYPTRNENYRVVSTNGLVMRGILK